MPDMNLTNEEAASLARYPSGAQPANTSEPQPRPSAQQFLEGKNHFDQFNCDACHQPGPAGQPSPPTCPPKLGGLNLTAGCLSAQQKGAPDFHLSATQRKAIQTALQNPIASPTPADQIKMRLTQLNCIACHVRDDYGGVAPELDQFFHSSEEALGNEARIPPPLTLTGAKLRHA